MVAIVIGMTLQCSMKLAGMRTAHPDDWQKTINSIYLRRLCTFRLKTVPAPSARAGRKL
jgi:hypothetical protein